MGGALRVEESREPAKGGRGQVRGDQQERVAWTGWWPEGRWLGVVS